MKLTIEMPLVTHCDATHCGYNVGQKCHAKAITVGDAANPACDTYFQAPNHSHEVKRIAGVGACKVAECQYNSDYECAAKNIDVGASQHGVTCMTFRRKAA